MKFKTILMAMVVCSVFIVCGTVSAIPYMHSETQVEIDGTQVNGMVDEGTATTHASHSSVGEYSDVAQSSANTGMATDGDGFVSVDQMSMGLHTISTFATSTWSDLYEVTSAGNYSFDFTISGGEIYMSDWSNSIGNRQTALGANLRSGDGTTLWNTYNTVYGGGGHFSYNEWGTDIGGDVEELSWSMGDPEDTQYEISITYGEYTGSVNLGYYEEGDTIELTYSMEVSSQDMQLGDVCPDGYALPAQAWANLSDPFSVDGVGITYNGGGPAAPVPEPATILLMGTGLVGTALARRRAKKTKK